MRTDEITREEVYGISDEDYAHQFTVQEVVAIRDRYSIDLRLLEAQLEALRKFYREGVVDERPPYIPAVLSMSDLEGIIIKLQDKRLSVKSSLSRWEKLVVMRTVL